MSQEDVPVVCRKIVIGMDGSNNANDAYEWYLKHVYREEDYVIFGYCPSLSGGVFNMDSLMPNNLTAVGNAVRAAQENAREVQKILEDKLKHAGIRGCVEVISASDPGHALVGAAEKEHASMIVIGSRGHGALRRTVMGSVSGYIMHHSHVPVLVHPHIHHHGHHKDKNRKGSMTEKSH